MHQACRHLAFAAITLLPMASLLGQAVQEFSLPRAGAFPHPLPPTAVVVARPVVTLLDGLMLFAQWGMLADPSGLTVVTSAAVRLRLISL